MAIETIPQSGLWGDIADTINANNSGQLVKSAWVNPLDDYTITQGDSRIDGFPDGGAQTFAIYSLLAPTAYPVGWSCDVYNDTAQFYLITIEDENSTIVRELKQGEGVNIRVTDAQDGFVLVEIKGDTPPVLDPAIYADFDNFIAWQDTTFRRAIIPNATAAQINGFAPYFVPLGGAGIFYTFDIAQRNDENGYLIQVSVTSTQDSDNPSIGRIFQRFGPNMATSTAQEWSVPALLRDAEVQLFANQQSYVIQQPVDTATPMLVKFDDSGLPVNAGGSIELLADGGTWKFNKIKPFTLDLTAQFGRLGASGVSELVLYAAINFTTDASVAVDSDYVPFGRQFSYEISNADVLISQQYSSKYFKPPSLPFSIRYYLRRLPTGNDSGGLFPISLAAFNHFGNSYGNGSSAAGASVWEHGA
jgi:hypothetical protein